MRGKILCFGELLLRLCLNNKGEWLKQQSIPVYVGGAEANVAAALANWQLPVKYFSAIPDNYLSKKILDYLQQKKIDTDSVKFLDGRLGLYFLQQGTDVKNAAVIYDREHSSFSKLKKGMIDWDEVLKDVSWFHFSAINPALNKNIAAVCEEALQAATRRNITVSVDLNYRTKLWQYGKQPVEIMPSFLPYCNIVMGNIWSANIMLGTTLHKNLIEANTKEAYIEHALKTSEDIQKQFSKCKHVANTFRFDKNITGIKYYSTLFAENKLYISPEFSTDKIIDKVGSGDCFMAGLIYGLYHNYLLQDTLNFASAAGFGKLQEKSDMTSQSVKHIQSTIKKYE